MDDQRFWGQLIKQLREEQKISCTMMASMVGLHRSRLRRLEKGQGALTVDILSRVASVLGYELDLFKKESQARMMS